MRADRAAKVALLAQAVVHAFIIVLAVTSGQFFFLALVIAFALLTSSGIREFRAYEDEMREAEAAADAALDARLNEAYDAWMDREHDRKRQANEAWARGEYAAADPYPAGQVRAYPYPGIWPAPELWRG